MVTPDPPWGTGNSWLTTVTFDRDVRPGASTRVREALQAQNIESRPIWKPMHQQPVFRDHEAHLTGVADRLFEEGLCLPSGVGLSDGDIERVGQAVAAAVKLMESKRNSRIAQGQNLRVVRFLGVDLAAAATASRRAEFSTRLIVRK